MGTEAQKKANKKYHDKTYKAFTVNAKITEYEKITEYCVNNDQLVGMAKKANG